MAKAFTPKDCHALMNLLVKEATGQQTITVVDTSSFVSAGETVLATGMENVLNSLSIVIGKTLFAQRPYTAKLKIINALNTDGYTNRLRKISFYARENVASGDFNTDLYTNFAPGYDNGTNGGQSTKNMWEMNLPVTLEMNFAGSDVWETSYTVLEDQLKVAFRSESEFGRFVSAMISEKMNDIESNKEAFNRMALLNKIGATYNMSANMPGSVVNLTTAFNAHYGTNYTSEQLRTTYLESFLAFFVTQFKLASDYLENRSNQYHWSPTKSVGGTNYTLLRHTPKNKQRTILYTPLFTEAKANVFPSIFNPSYLDLNTQYEGVTYWQSFTTPSAVKLTPAQPNTQTGVQEKGEEVNIPYVVGMLYDVDGLMVDYQLDRTTPTPLEARKNYRNIWFSAARNVICDQTENIVLFIMQDQL